MPWQDVRLFYNLKRLVLRQRHNFKPVCIQNSIRIFSINLWVVLICGISTQSFFSIFYNINVFLFISVNSTCASPRDLMWLYHIMRGYTYIYTLKATLPLHRVWHRVRVIAGSCTNCGVIRESDGLCARCLDLPYCKVCKRHLSHSSFNGQQCHICQVPLHVAIACILYFAHR